MIDPIERQEAIDALEREKTFCTAYQDGYAKHDVFDKYNMGLADGIKALRGLPSAKPELLTDEEQRIFLAAMGRQEVHCRQVEELWLRLSLPSDTNLISICREIERKVKNALF